MTRPWRALTCALHIVCCALVVSASAQSTTTWSVQVVALRDYREAQAAATELRVLEFDVYTEFAMLDGQQYVRVRVGCFTTRDAAESAAAVMRGRITAEAEAVEATDTAPVLGCVHEEIGFLNSYDWELMTRPGEVPVFSVTVAGVPARLTHDGRRWSVLQGRGSGEQATLADPSSARFVQRQVAGAPFATLDSLPGPVLLCSGRLVASVADVAIVARGDAVVACRLLVDGALETLR